MNWLSKLIPGRDGAPLADAGAAEIIARWEKLPAFDPNTPHFETRYTVVNTEASGLNVDQDTLLSVGAIAINEGHLSSVDSYYPSLAPDPATVLARLVAFAGKGPIIVFGAAFNRTMLERAYETHLGFVPELIWLDLYILLPALFPERLQRPSRLADWMEAFGIETFQRHHALGDAWVIAQLTLAAQSRALAQGMTTPRLLADMERSRRQIQRQT